MNVTRLGFPDVTQRELKMVGSQRSMAGDDPDLAIDWQFEGVPSLSAKDARGTSLRDAEVFA